MYVKLLFRRFSQIATIANAAFASTSLQSAVPAAAYVQHLLRSPLYFVLKGVGPAMAPVINDGVAERAVGQVWIPCVDYSLSRTEVAKDHYLNHRTYTLLRSHVHGGVDAFPGCPVSIALCA